MVAAPKAAAMTLPAAPPVVAAAAAAVVVTATAPAEAVPVATAVAPVAATAVELNDIALRPSPANGRVGPQRNDVGRYVLSRCERGETHFRAFVLHIRQCRSLSRLLAFCIGLYRQTDRQTDRQTVSWHTPFLNFALHNPKPPVSVQFQCCDLQRVFLSVL